MKSLPACRHDGTLLIAPPLFSSKDADWSAHPATDIHFEDVGILQGFWIGNLSSLASLVPAEYTDHSDRCCVG